MAGTRLKMPRSAIVAGTAGAEKTRWKPRSSSSSSFFRSNNIFLILFIYLVLSFLDNQHRIPWSVALTHATVVSTSEELRTAIEINRPPVVTLNPGVYYINNSLTITSITQTIRALVPGTVTISGQNQTRIFELLVQPTLTLANLTLEDGLGEAPPAATAAFPETPRGGGCIGGYTLTAGSFQASQLTMTSVTFRRCSTFTGNGGAVMIYFPFASSVQCTDCVFEDNQAPGGSGGGLYYSIYDNPEIGLRLQMDRATFSGNRAELGGGMFIESPASPVMRFTDVVFFNNTASTYGGALGMTEEVNLISSEFLNNSAGLNEGHAISLVSARFNMDDNTSMSFLGNGGIDGYVGKFPQVIRGSPTLVRVVAFTPVPTLSNTLPPASPLPQPTFPPFTPTVPPSNPSSDASNPTSYIAIATSVILAVIISLTVIMVVLYHRKRAQQRRNQQQAEEQHNAFANRRNHRPQVVTFKEILPADFAPDICAICNDEHVDDSTIAKSLGTISATRAGLTSVLSLSSSYGVVDCGHVFHVACTTVWCEVNGKTTCPTCRHTIAHDVKRRQSSQTSSSGGPASAAARRSTGAGSTMVPGAFSAVRRSTGASNASGTNAVGTSRMLRYSRSAPNIFGVGKSNNSNDDDDDDDRDADEEKKTTPAATKLVVAVPADVPFGHVARRSTNMEDLQAENAVLVREMNQAVARLEDVRQSRSGTTPKGGGGGPAS